MKPPLRRLSPRSPSLCPPFTGSLLQPSSGPIWRRVLSKLFQAEAAGPNAWVWMLGGDEGGVTDARRTIVIDGFPVSALQRDHPPITACRSTQLLSSGATERRSAGTAIQRTRAKISMATPPAMSVTSPRQGGREEMWKHMEDNKTTLPHMSSSVPA